VRALDHFLACLIDERIRFGVTCQVAFRLAGLLKEL
jgi:hypothetical protein